MVLIIKINLRTVKVTIICDQNKVPLIIAANRANIHDSKILSTSKLINDSLNNIQKDFNFNKIVLVGDKGYILNKTQKRILLKRNIKLIHPYRKNQKNKNSKTNKKLLKERHKVEKLFALSVKQGLLP